MTDANADEEDEERTDDQTQYGDSGEDLLVGAEGETEDDAESAPAAPGSRRRSAAVEPNYFSRVQS
ncbi:hypothetical protein [Salinilacihabitans rarus]|uniref:hypothetical protein n=1 Tax=Salinilacihabitans rarus TaxID=2961596 RepID=UPI0020C88A75|nr:hypothetical protein [Salinilacihabitans rarus]